MARGEFRDDVDPRILRRALFGAIDEVSLTWVAARRNDNPQPYSIEKAADQIWRLFAVGLGRPPQRSAP